MFFLSSMWKELSEEERNEFNRRTLSEDAITAGCLVPIFSSFFLFFEPIPIFVYFLTKISCFSYFLACEAKICNQIEYGIIVVFVLE